MSEITSLKAVEEKGDDLTMSRDGKTKGKETYKSSSVYTLVGKFVSHGVQVNKSEVTVCIQPELNS